MNDMSLEEKLNVMDKELKKAKKDLEDAEIARDNFGEYLSEIKRIIHSNEIDETKLEKIKRIVDEYIDIIIK